MKNLFLLILVCMATNVFAEDTSNSQNCYLDFEVELISSDLSGVFLSGGGTNIVAPWANGRSEEFFAQTEAKCISAAKNRLKEGIVLSSIFVHKPNEVEFLYEADRYIVEGRIKSTK